MMATGEHLLAATAGPAAAQVKSSAGCSVTDRESPWVTVLTGTWRARSCWALASASCSPVEGPCSGGDLDVPAEPPELSFEVCWPMGYIHQPVGGSVGDLPADGRRRRAFHEFVWGAVGVVDEKHAAIWFETVSHQ